MKKRTRFDMADTTAAATNPRLTEMQCEVLALVTDQWQGQRAIVWTFNGPRETTIPQAQIEAILSALARKRLIESRGRKTRAGLCGNNPLDYRRRAPEPQQQGGEA